MPARTTDLPRFAALDPTLDRAVLTDPYPTYAALRATSPLCRGGPAQWVVTRHTEVTALLQDRRLTGQFPAEFHQIAEGVGPASEFTFHRDNVFSTNPRLHRLMTASFTSAGANRLRHWVTGLVDNLVAEAAGRGVADLAGDVAVPLAIETVGHLLGLPAAERWAVGSRAIELEAKAFGATFLPDAAREDANETFAWLRSYLDDLLAQRRRNPSGDLLSTLVTLAEPGDDPGALLDQALFVASSCYSGLATVIGLLTNGCFALLDQPDELARLRSDPGLLPSAVEELLRFDAPVQLALRMTTEVVEVAGYRLRPRRVVVLLLGSANRDERCFTEPDRLNLRRRPNPHAAFGGGMYRCVAAPFARTVGAIALSRLVRPGVDLDLGGDPVRPPVLRFRYFSCLPVRVRIT
jgi:cytochrome P450